MNPAAIPELTPEQLRTSHQRLILIAAILTDSGLANTLGSTTAAASYLAKQGYQFPDAAIGGNNAQGNFEPSQMFSDVINRMGSAPSIKYVIVALAVQAEQEDYSEPTSHRFSVNALLAATPNP